MKAVIVDGYHRRTTAIFPLNDGVRKMIVFQTRQMGGNKWNCPAIE
jgi:hypothetical protein